MYRIPGTCLLALALATPIYSQALHSGKLPSTEWLLDTQVGSDPGYKLPYIALGVSFQRPITKHIEFQGGVSYSPTKTLMTNDGRGVGIQGEVDYWLIRRVAATASLRWGELWTSEFNSQGWRPAIGFAIREHSFDSPGRFYFSYVIPTGCQWGAGCQVQSDRKTGPKVYWEHRVWTHWRWGFEFGVYRVLNQGNPLDRAAGRTRQITGDAHVVSRFEFPGGDLNEDY